MADEKPDSSERLIRRTINLKAQLEVALRELEDYANTLQEEVSHLREHNEDD